MTSPRLVLRGGSVVTLDGPVRADVAIDGERISRVGSVDPVGDDRVIDASDRLVLPGFVDAHSHTDGLVSEPAVQQALLRQGVTSVIVGQDGVSYAPGPGTYASEYFAVINGPHPTYRGGGVAAYLESCDGASALNVGCLVPAGTVRHEVCGRDPAPATPEQRERMAGLVTRGMAEGALGLSTGLDYVPGLFATTAEIAALCEPVARAGGVYVSHMRGGYEANSAAGVDEIAEIAGAVTTSAPLPVHVSHFHADADIVLDQLARLEAAGVNATFDAYPYVRACSLLSMPLLPPELTVRPVDEAVSVLSDPGARPALRAACVARVTASASLGPEWPDQITLAHLSAPQYAWAHGLTLATAGRRAGVEPMDFALDVLAASRLEVSAIMAVRRPRADTELARIFADPRQIAGSDGIFIGVHPHPRGFGTFARYLRVFVRELGTWTWADAVHHLSALPARRFALGRRGSVAAGAVADLVLVDPDTVSDAATYDNPRQLAVGIDDVLVAGVPVLADGELTSARPGRGLRRTTTESIIQEGHSTVAKTAIHTTRAPQPAGPYSQGVEANGFLFTAGFGPQDPARDHAVAESVADQTRQVLRNVQAVLAERGLTLDDCVKTTVHLADLADFAEFNAAYEEFFTRPYPVRTTVGSQLANILVEIDVVAALSQT